MAVSRAHPALDRCKAKNPDGPPPLETSADIRQVSAVVSTLTPECNNPTHFHERGGCTTELPALIFPGMIPVLFPWRRYGVQYMHTLAHRCEITERDRLRPDLLSVHHVMRLAPAVSQWKVGRGRRSQLPGGTPLVLQCVLRSYLPTTVGWYLPR